MNDTPDHRREVSLRSGDTHVIGADGEAVNVDQAAREKADREFATAAAARLIGDDGKPVELPPGDLSDPPAQFKDSRSRAASSSEPPAA